MTLRRCTCGRTPDLFFDTGPDHELIQVRCRCGQRGQAATFTERGEQLTCEQLATDRWNGLGRVLPHLLDSSVSPLTHPRPRAPERVPDRGGTAGRNQPLLRPKEARGAEPEWTLSA